MTPWSMDVLELFCYLHTFKIIITRKIASRFIYILVNTIYFQINFVLMKNLFIIDFNPDFCPDCILPNHWYMSKDFRLIIFYFILIYFNTLNIFGQILKYV